MTVARDVSVTIDPLLPGSRDLSLPSRRAGGDPILNVIFDAKRGT